MAALFTAADIAGLATSVTAILVAFIGVRLLFTGDRHIKKSGVK
jgi:hypothetical protein